MSHERSTPSPGTEEFASSPSPSSPSRFANTPSGFTRDNVPLTSLERYAMGRSNETIDALSGAIGGFASGVVTCPLDVIKTKLQAQGGFRAQAQAKALPSHSPVMYRGMLGTANVIWREEGLRGMYRGLGPMVLGYVPTWAVWFTVYGKSKGFFSQYIDNVDGVNFCSSIVAGTSSTLATNPIWVIKTRLMSQVSRNKIMASSATYPHEVIRTRLQTQQRSLPSASSEYSTFRGGLESSGHYKPATIIATTVIPRYKGIVTTFKTILREEGWRAFYAGMGTNLMRAVPAATTTILTYEYVKQQLTNAKAEAVHKSNTW
ncbi:hypothetical protein G7Y89_g737 [Cudoniella acicularis]|uniref:Mitochondrial carrier protein n=1 Tax=Cudoniella acicularis TaxID=354080 RepID=A0A8H4RWL5_9HELO|nr:hypothetical protein G7Y89_g737 [Cudoniella acicularis]